MLRLLKSTPTIPRLRRPSSVTIKPYKLGMTYNQTLPPHIYADNPLLSAMFNALSAQFPAGERFLIQSVRLFQEQITDAELKKDARGFIGQEAHHANEHEQLSLALKEAGIPTDMIEKHTEWMLEKICSTLSAKDQLAATAALEHFTAMLGSLFLSNPNLAKEVHPTLKALFVWHAIEESEHKAVAFDVYQNTIGSYPRLMLAYLWTSSLLTIVTSYYIARIMLKEGSVFKISANLKGLNWMFGFGKNNGHLRRMLPEYFSFFRPNYHPWATDNSADIFYWKGVLDELTAELENDQISAQ